MKAVQHCHSVKKYDFGHGRGSGHKIDITVNTNDFTVNVAYISITINSKPLQYGCDTVMQPRFHTMIATYRNQALLKK